MRGKKLLSLMLVLSMLVSLLTVLPALPVTAEGETGTLVYQKAGEWELATWENYLGVNNDSRQGNCHITQGNKYQLEFDLIAANSASAWVYFDWANSTGKGDDGVTKSNSKSYSDSSRLKYALLEVVSGGTNDCVQIGPYSGGFNAGFPQRNDSRITYHYVILWDTVNSTFDITLTYGTGSHYHTTYSYAATGNRVEDSDVLKFVNYGQNDAGYSRVKDFSVYEITADPNAPVYQKSGDWTITGPSYLMFNGDGKGADNNMHLTIGNTYEITFDVAFPSGSTRIFYLDWCTADWQHSKSGLTGYNNLHYLMCTVAGGSTDYLSLKGTQWTGQWAHEDKATYTYKVIWDTAQNTFDLKMDFLKDGVKKGTLHDTYTAGQSVANTDILTFWTYSNNPVTVTDLTVRDVTPETTPEPTAEPVPTVAEPVIYTAANGWSLGGAAECVDGSLKLGKGAVNAASFTPALERGKVYEITYDVSGLLSSADGDTVPSVWKKPFTLSLSAGGQTENDVLTYRMGGAWRDATTDQGYSPGSNGQNKVVIDTASGAWETYALGNKATYSGFTSDANGYTKTYNAFADVTDFTLKFYARDTSSDFETPYISNVTVTEVEPDGSSDVKPELLSYDITSGETRMDTPDGLSSFDLNLHFQPNGYLNSDMIALAVVYDAIGRKVGMGKTVTTVGGLDTDVSVPVTLSVPFSDAANTLKVFTWDGLLTMKPYMRALCPTQGITVMPVASGADLHNDIMRAYLNDDYNNILDYAWGSFDKDDPKPVTFRWIAKSGLDSYTLEVGERADLSDARTVTTDALTADVYNLKLDTTYYYRVSATDGNETAVSDIFSFTTNGDAPRMIRADGLSNGRDVGGWSTADGGKVKQGMVYRSYCFDYVKDGKTVTLLRADGIDTLVNELGIKSEVDLRSESSKTSSILGNGVNYYRYGMGYSGDYLASNQASIKSVFEVLADPDNYPVIWHCQAGADRTGAVTYLLNGLLGVSKEDLLRDYLITNFSVADYGTRTVETIANRYVKTLDEYEGNTLSDKIYHYLHNEIGVSTDDLDFIKAHLVEN